MEEKNYDDDLLYLLLRRISDKTTGNWKARRTFIR